MLKGSRMQREWIGKKVDLMALVKLLEDFFANRGFSIKRDECAEKLKIRATLPHIPKGERARLEVVISGNSNDFTIELIGSERAHASMKLGLLTTMFGGGNIVLRSLRSREILDKFEREFWAYVEETVAQLVNSAGQFS